jgi:hypothetical protein
LWNTEIRAEPAFLESLMVIGIVKGLRRSKVLHLGVKIPQGLSTKQEKF